MKMSYQARNLLVLSDLYKLLDYKTSEKLKNAIYSYIFIFSRYLGIEFEMPDHYDLLTDISVKDSNEVIMKRLRITLRQVEKLELETLREDAEQRRKQRYKENKYGAIPQFQYEKILKVRRQETYQEYLKQKEQGIFTTQIAKNIGVSRRRLYQIITKERDG